MSLVITLLLMGISTVLVGCLPTYETIGIVAPILLILLRAMQGLAVGGEWGGAVLMSVEHAPEGKKTFYGGFTQLGNPAGALLASGIFAIMSRFGDDFIMNGGWRIPFLLSVVLIAVGFWVRYRVEESPVFEQKVEGRKQSMPLAFALRVNWKPILLGIGLLPISTGGYYLATTFATAYATGEQIGMSSQLILDAMTIASFIEFVVTLPVAWLGDKWGRKNVMYIGLVTSVLTFVPFMLVLPGRVEPVIFLLASLVRIAMSFTYAPIAAILAQMFRPQARYTSHRAVVRRGRGDLGRLLALVRDAADRVDGQRLVGARDVHRHGSARRALHVARAAALRRGAGDGLVHAAHRHHGVPHRLRAAPRRPSAPPGTTRPSRKTCASSPRSTAPRSRPRVC